MRNSFTGTSRNVARNETEREREKVRGGPTETADGACALTLREKNRSAYFCAARRRSATGRNVSRGVWIRILRSNWERSSTVRTKELQANPREDRSHSPRAENETLGFGLKSRAIDQTIRTESAHANTWVISQSVINSVKAK